MIPRYTTPFLGRAAEQAGIVRALDGTTGPLTLHGPGGMGKTRLASEVASGWAGQVAFVELGARAGHEGLVSGVGRALGVVASDQLGDRIQTWLARGGLLVLDEFEHLPRTAADSVATWAEAGAVLVTSQHPLDVAGERVYSLGPLGVHGVALFIALAPAQARADEDPDRVQAIVRDLDGLPLAIELAAARLEVLSLTELQERLDQRFSVLRVPGRAGAKHGALRAVLECSWQLLEPWEQRALLQCTVFTGGFDLRAADAVLSLGDDHEPLDAVHALARKSLIRVRRGDPTRYSLAESVRAFAAEQAPPGDDVDRRHAVYFADSWSALAEAQGDGEPERWLREEPNLLRAFAFACDHGPLSVVHRLAHTLRRLLAGHAPPAAILQILDRALHLAEEAADQRVILDLLYDRSATRLTAHHTEAAGVDARRAMSLAEALGDDRKILYLSGLLGQIAADVPDRRDEAVDWYSRVIEAADRLGDPRAKGLALSALGMEVHYEAGQMELAFDCVRRAVEALGRSVDEGNHGGALGHLGYLHAETGNDDEALALLERALESHRRSHFQWFERSTLGLIGTLTWIGGDRPRAQALWTEALKLAEDGEDWKFAAQYDGALALPLLFEGEFDRAVERVDAALARLGAHPDFRHRGQVLSLSAAVRAAIGDEETARDHLELARPLLAGSQIRGAQLAVVGGISSCWRSKAALRTGDRATAIAARAQAEAARPPATAGWEARLVGTVLDWLLDRSPAPEEALLVDRAGTWFDGEAGRRDLSRRATIARVLAHLVEAHLDDAERWSSVDALFAAGWPGEHAVPKAAANRVYNALSTLRSCGVPIAKTSAGWRLEPTRPLCVVVSQQGT